MDTTNLKLLAIDNDQDNLTTLEAIVREALPGCTLLTALNGSHGVELARTEDPDTIVVNIVMPGMDGFEVCRTLKADGRLRLIPVLFLAPQADRQSRVKALEEGAEGFLAKPVDEVELLAQIRVMAKLKEANRLQQQKNEQLAALVTERTRELEQELAERKRTEAELRGSQEQHRTILRTAMDGFCRVDLRGRLLEVNEAYCRMSGYGEQELLAMSISDLETAESPADTAARSQTIAAQGEHRFESRHRRKDGSQFAVEISAQYKPAGGGYIVAFLRDITARQQAEEQLRHATEQWERTFDAVPDLICLLDTQHTVVRANQAMAARLGVTTEQAVGLACYQCVHGLPSPPDFCPHTRLLQDQQEHTVEVHEDRLGGDFLVTCTPLRDQDGRLLGSVHVAHDITDRKRAEETLRDSEVRYRRLFESAKDGIFILDAETGIIVDANPFLIEMLGFSYEQLIGKTIWELGFLKDIIANRDKFLLRSAGGVGNFCRISWAERSAETWTQRDEVSRTLPDC